MSKKLILITDSNYTVWALKVKESKIDHVAHIIDKAYNKYYGNDKLHEKHGGFYEYVDSVLNEIDGVEILDFEPIELNPHW